MIYPSRVQNMYIMQTKDDKTVTNERFKRLKDYFKHPNAIKAINIISENEQRRYKNGDYNREGIDDID